ncbi:MAG TPA: MgtC/SapB family protein, partial [Gammaproteobacteria bacterium]|nr:MgtC/SapB family protein [Gammaproteobacteria bacterium]
MTAVTDSLFDVFRALGVALAIGLLVGFERGWAQRGVRTGERVAGLRTFGIVGLLGGVAALLGRELAPVVLGLAFLAM